MDRSSLIDVNQHWMPHLLKRWKLHLQLTSGEVAKQMFIFGFHIY